MSEKLDVKKDDKHLYLPKAKPVIVDVPAMTFIMVDGKGNPGDEDGEYAKAVEILYSLTYAIKMSPKSGMAPAGYVEYVVPPLEGLWWTAEDQPFDGKRKEDLIWTSMIRQPEFVTDDVFRWAVEQVKKKKPHVNLEKARLATFSEGRCVQMMHLGPYDTEAQTVLAIDAFAASQGYVNAISQPSPEGLLLRHHEIYLNDPRKTDPEKMKTVVRHPIQK